jgi:hypothetical protein
MAISFLHTCLDAKTRCQLPGHCNTPPVALRKTMQLVRYQKPHSFHTLAKASCTMQLTPRVSGGTPHPSRRQVDVCMVHSDGHSQEGGVFKIGPDGLTLALPSVSHRYVRASLTTVLPPKVRSILHLGGVKKSAY